MIAIVGVALLWALTPTIACLSPLAEMAMAPEKCCHATALECGSGSAPQAQSCCPTAAHPDNASLAARPASTLVHLVAAALLTQPVRVDVEGRSAAFSLASSHSPPGPDASSLQVLRI